MPVDIRRGLHWLALVLIALAVAHGGYLVTFGFQACSVQANDAGEPRNDEVCERFVSYPGLGIVALLALAGVALVARRPRVAWAPWGLATATALLFGFSLGMLLYHCAIVLVGLVLGGMAARRPPAA